MTPGGRMDDVTAGSLSFDFQCVLEHGNVKVALISRSATSWAPTRVARTVPDEGKSEKEKIFCSFGEVVAFRLFPLQFESRSLRLGQCFQWKVLDLYGHVGIIGFTPIAVAPSNPLWIQDQITADFIYIAGGISSWLIQDTSTGSSLMVVCKPCSNILWLENQNCGAPIKVFFLNCLLATNIYMFIILVMRRVV